METKNYYRIFLGPKSVHAHEAYDGGFIGADFGLDIDLTERLPENWREFNKEFIPRYLEKSPDKSKVAAGLSCGMLWTVAKGVSKGDIVVCPTGEGDYYVGDVTGDYEYHKGEILPHRRKVSWYRNRINKDSMSESLKNSVGSIGTVSNITKYSEEIEDLIEGQAPASIIATDKEIEDPTAFALEMHLEDFLVHNWAKTELGKHYDIYEENGEIIGRQYPSDTGPIDILAISKDKKKLLVVELKRGRAPDSVVGQIQRYMGYVKEELADKDQSVEGVIIALEDDLRVRRALQVTQNIDFYTYIINFSLSKVIESDSA